MQLKPGIAICAIMALGSSLPVFAQQACLRVAHHSPDGPAVDVLIDGVEVYADASFPFYQPYVNLQPRGYHLQITLADQPGSVLLEKHVLVEANRSYTVAVLGEAAALELMILKDDTVPVPPGFGASRIFHASPDAPVVDVVRPDGVVLLENLAFGNATEYTLLPVGNYDIVARDQEGGELGTWTIEVISGEVITGAAVGFADGEPPITGAAPTDFPNDCSLQYQQVDHSGMWFDPTRNGQGLQLVQRGMAMQGAWYAYDDMGQSTFYTFVGELDGEGDFSGDLLSFSGPVLGSVSWDDSLVVGEPVGSVSIEFADLFRQARMDWMVDGGPSGTLSLVPYMLPFNP